ncbi:MAG TPA: hypothetical protein DDW97_00895 [Anaerolineaceae bacterium]|nr:hypothetical protein [Anaerolineaceae bacterium]
MQGLNHNRTSLYRGLILGLIFVGRFFFRLGWGCRF